MTFDGNAFVRYVAERLIQEFRFSQGAGTPGLIGAAKEHPARIQLEKLMPGGVRVGSGIVVDSYGGVSRQQDIVIYERLCPVFTHNDATEATYYPVEGVIAIGEVKSGFGKKELCDAVDKSVSVKRLHRHAVPSNNEIAGRSVAYRRYGSELSFAGTPDEQFNQERRSLDQIYSFVLCQRFLASPQTTLENLAQECRKTGVALMPNMIISLENGGIYPFDSRSGSITRAMMDGDSAIFSQDSVWGFAQLVKRLRLYVVSGRTVEREHFERYFQPRGGDSRTIQIDASVVF